jgi:hypothetical protein
MRYTHIVSPEDDEYLSKGTNNKQEALQLISEGWQFVNSTPEGYMLYRKRK